MLGGLAIFIAFAVTLIVEAVFTKNIFGGFFLPKHLFVILLGGLVLVVGGFLDDKYKLKPYQQIIFPIVSALVVVAGGLGVEYITSPIGGTLYLNQFKFTIFSYHGLPYQIVLFADLFSFIWILVMSYSTKFLDGLDGLVSGITTIGAFIIFILSLSKEVAQPETAILSIALAGVMLGFLIFHFHPARIFLGEGGSTFCGFSLGVLAILSGSKIATALLIMGVPVLDAVWVILRRIFQKKSPFMSDKKHLHFRLLDVGFSVRQAVLFLYVLTLVFGLVSLFISGKEKLIALIILAVVVLALAGTVTLLYKRKQKA